MGTIIEKAFGGDYFKEFSQQRELTSLDARRNKIIREMFNGDLDERHTFRISEENVSLNETQSQQIESLTNAMPQFIDGIGRLAKLCLINDKLRRTDQTYRNLRAALDLGGKYNDILHSGSEKSDCQRDIEAEEAALNTSISQYHPFTRLDLVIDPHTDDLKIVEIEEAKLHGFGYATMCREMSDDKLGCGLAETLAQATAKTPTGMLLSEGEKFYEPEANYFAKKVNAAGGNLTVIPQRELHVDNQRLIKKQFMSHKPFYQILTLPEFQGRKSDVNDMNRNISRLYAKGQLNVMSFKSPMLGNKSCLALVSNSHNNPQVEHLLQQCFDSQTLDLLRKHIPATTLPISSFERSRIGEELKSGRQMFIKVVDASGARGIGTPGDIETQLKLLRSGKVIAQEAIESAYFHLPYMNLMTGSKGEADFTLRIGAFGLYGNLADVAITASPSAVAHGGTKSIQTGIKILN